MQACNHTWKTSLETCQCGKVRAASKGDETGMQAEREIKVRKKVDQQTQSVVPGQKLCAILSGDEFVRRQWRHLVRMVKEMERQYGFRFDSEN